MLPRSSAEFHRSQQRLAVATVTAARRAWSGMGADFDRSWVAVAPRLVVVTSAAQMGAARAGAEYVPNVLAETSQPDDPLAEVNPRGFVGTASDGRSLNGLLYGAVTEAKTASGQGLPPTLALERGGRWLDMAVHTLVSDTGRLSTGVGIAARPRTGWVRMVNPPCCSRCAILAGKFFRYSQGFQRHPRCDCTHVPSVEDRADDFRTDPQALVNQGHVTDLTEAQRMALEDGADLNRVINADRRSSGMTTLEAAPRRQRRLTPEGIYARTHDREQAVELLKQHGYLR